MQMLHSLDRCHMDLDSKWASVVEHTADKAEFRYRLAGRRERRGGGVDV